MFVFTNIIILAMMNVKLLSPFQVFGTDHLYNCDTFNEMTPKSNSAEYLSAAGKSVYEGMAKADPDAVWVMQGWLFLSHFWGNEQVEALVTSVPKVNHDLQTILDFYLPLE